MEITKLDTADLSSWIRKTHEHIEATQPEGERRGGLRALRASNAGLALECPRQLGYWLIDCPPDRNLDARALATFATGDEAHDRWRAQMIDAKVGLEHVEEELTIPLDLDDRYISVHIDGTIPLGEPWNGRFSYELKTASDFEFKRWTATPPQPSQRTLAQAHIESHAAFQAGLADPDYFAMECINKMNQVQVGLVVSFSTVFFNQVMAGYKLAYKASYVATLTAREQGATYSVNDCVRGFGPNAKMELPWQCGYCPFSRRCWENCDVEQVGKNDKKLRLMAPRLQPPEILVRWEGHGEEEWEEEEVET